MIIFSILVNYIIGLGLLLIGKIFFGFEATSFSIFFVLPIGAFISGVIMGGGFARGIYKRNIKNTGKTVFINLIFGVLFFVSIQYAYYQVTYLDDNMSINYKFEGKHISEYSFSDSNEPINFISFTVDKINAQTITFTRKAVREIGKVEGNKLVNWIFFGIDFLGFLFGVYIAYKIKFDDAIYCEKCALYMKDEVVLKLSSNIEEKYARLTEVLAKENIEELKKFISENPHTENPMNETYLEGTLYKCEECSAAHLIFKGYKKNEKGKYVHNSAMDTKIDVSQNLIVQL